MVFDQPRLRDGSNLVRADKPVMPAIKSNCSRIKAESWFANDEEPVE